MSPWQALTADRLAYLKRPSPSTKLTESGGPQSIAPILSSVADSSRGGLNSLGLRWFLNRRFRRRYGRVVRYRDNRHITSGPYRRQL